MKNNNNTRKYGHGENRKDGRLVMRMTGREDTKLNNLTRYLGKTRSEVMRDALDMLYCSEGGDDICNRPAKNSSKGLTLSETDMRRLNELSEDLGESASDIVRKAVGLYKAFKEMD